VLGGLILFNLLRKLHSASFMCQVLRWNSRVDSCKLLTNEEKFFLVLMSVLGEKQRWGKFEVNVLMVFE
jgi:hypothetical protein